MSTQKQIAKIPQYDLARKKEVQEFVVSNAAQIADLILSIPPGRTNILFLGSSMAIYNSRGRKIVVIKTEP